MLAAFQTGGADAANAFALLALGFLIKAGAIGAHVWMPGAYAEADDDLSAMLSSVISKVAIFGLFVVTYLAIRSEAGLELAHLMGWIGMLTTVAGAVMALQQDDVKRLLAYSSMSQLGYIVTAIALMSHLGWVTALYLVANHLMVKGILFLAVAGVILRTGTRLMDGHGGLARNMPLTFAAVVIALVSMSGLPPLAGFGGKWLLLSAMMDKGWYWLVALGVLATFIGFLYMFRLAYAVFLGPRKAGHEAVREAPAAASAAAVRAGRGNPGLVVLPQAGDGPGFRGDRSLFRLDAGLGRHVAGDDLRLLEPRSGHGRHHGRRGLVVCLVMAGLQGRPRPRRTNWRRPILPLLSICHRCGCSAAGGRLLGSAFHIWQAGRLSWCGASTPAMDRPTFCTCCTTWP